MRHDLAFTLNSLLKDREWSNNELAKRSGISEEAIEMLVYGLRQPSLDESEQLALAFDDSLAFFADSALYSTDHPGHEEYSKRVSDWYTKYN